MQIINIFRLKELNFRLKEFPSYFLRLICCVLFFASYLFRLKELKLQDGTNTVSKLQKSSNEILDDMFSLIDACKNKFQPDVFVLMEVIPFKETDYNRSKNKLIDEANAVLKRLESLGENFVLLKMNKLKRSIPSNPEINH